MSLPSKETLWHKTHGVNIWQELQENAARWRKWGTWIVSCVQLQKLLQQWIAPGKPVEYYGNVILTFLPQKRQSKTIIDWKISHIDIDIITQFKLGR